MMKKEWKGKCAIPQNLRFQSPKEVADVKYMMKTAEDVEYCDEALKTLNRTPVKVCIKNKLQP